MNIKKYVVFVTHFDNLMDYFRDQDPQQFWKIASQFFFLNLSH
jgi:hypothetical protein